MAKGWAKHGLSYALVGYIVGYVTRWFQEHGRRSAGAFQRERVIKTLHEMAKHSAQVEGERGDEDGR